MIIGSLGGIYGANTDLDRSSYSPHIWYHVDFCQSFRSDALSSSLFIENKMVSDWMVGQYYIRGWLLYRLHTSQFDSLPTIESIMESPASMRSRTFLRSAIRCFQRRH